MKTSAWMRVGLSKWFYLSDWMSNGWRHWNSGQCCYDFISMLKTFNNKIRKTSKFYSIMDNDKLATFFIIKQDHSILFIKKDKNKYL